MLGFEITPTQRVIAVTCVMSLGAGLFGADTGSIGSITTMPKFEEQFGVLTPLLQGIVVAIILVPSAVTGIMAGSVSDKLSRKRTISLGAFIFAIGSAISAGSPTLACLLVGRCVAGTGEGLFLGCTGVYLCEISPKHIRGKCMLIFQLFTTGAIAAAFFICYGTVNIYTSLSWRFPFALQTLTALILTVLAPMMPYSPRWLMSKGRRDEAEKVLDLLLGTNDPADRKELLATGAGVIVGSKRAAFLEIWSKGVRGRTALGAFLNVFQQLAGIDFVLFFAPLLFSQAGLDAQTSSFLASGVTGLVLTAMTICGYFYIDRIGRRPLFIGGGIAVSCTLYVIGAMYASGAAHTSVGKWVVIAFIELFALAFSGSWSMTVRLYSSEIQPSRTRAAATGFGQGVNQLANFIVALTAPEFLARSAYGPYFLYGAFTTFATFVAYIYMFETKGHSLETIDKTFEDSPYAIKWPAIFRTGQHANELRARKNSRSNSQQLPGETREEFRAHLSEIELKAIQEEMSN
ncbi:general substrate transporter [Leucosporidium creatinivorum]|uniref:General substrate transporter n=1 Tax=Leucosporidium creatinivorum TaxID=106004 RepID=A0A1Y2FYX9_9BASI|nr:general substrate transporter [Leucosporidium creatinivorum]